MPELQSCSILLFFLVIILEGVDYQGGNFVITFSGAASEAQCLNITILRDDEVEADEMFSLNLAVSEPRVRLGQVQVTTITITGKKLSLSCLLIKVDLRMPLPPSVFV